MLPHHRYRPIGWAGFGVLVFLLIAVPAACHMTMAQTPAAEALRLNEATCLQLGQLVLRIGQARDVGATQQRVVDEANRQMDAVRASGAFRRLVLGEIRRVYTSAQAPDTLKVGAYLRCITAPAGLEESP